MNILSLVLPSWVKYLTYFFFIAILFVLTFFAGMKHTQDAWDKSILEQTVKINVLVTKQHEISERTVIKYIDRIHEVEVKGETIEKEIPKYIDRGILLPTNWGLLHNEAASSSPISRAASASDGKTLTIDSVEALNTVVTNYNACNKYIIQLDELTSWVEEQRGIK